MRFASLPRHLSEGEDIKIAQSGEKYTPELVNGGNVQSMDEMNVNTPHCLQNLGE